MFLSSWSQQIGLRFEAADWFLYSRNISLKMVQSLWQKCRIPGSSCSTELMFWKCWISWRKTSKIKSFFRKLWKANNIAKKYSTKDFLQGILRKFTKVIFLKNFWYNLSFLVPWHSQWTLLASFTGVIVINFESAI